LASRSENPHLIHPECWSKGLDRSQTFAFIAALVERATTTCDNSISVRGASFFAPHTTSPARHPVHDQTAI
jgi:hypothetical protein